MAGLTNDDIVRVGRWDQRYARVLARVDLADGRVIAIIDSNGARGDVPYENVEWYFRTADGTWQCGSGGNTGYEGAGWSSGIAYAYGQADSPVVVEFRGTRSLVAPQVDRWWLYAALDNEDGDALPRRIEQP